jgi:AraC family transcriptional regulator
MNNISTRIETSLSVPGLTARLATYEASGPGPFLRGHAKHYLTHILTPELPDVRVGRPDRGARDGFSPAGHLQFMPTWHRVQFRSSGRASRVAQCIFDPEYFQRITRGHPEPGEEKLLRYVNIHNRRIREPMLRIERELADPAFDSLIVIESLGRLLMVEIARQFWRDPQSVKSHGKLSPRQVTRIGDFVRANCGNASYPPISTLSDLCGISAGYLMRSFKNTTGETLHDFITRIRLEKARDLLRLSDIPLKQVAAASGFGTQSHFSYCFRRLTGERPSRYRMRS